MQFLSPDSYWLQSQRQPLLQCPALKGECRADVAIIGAGITGLTAALHLKQAGRKVVVLEAGRIGAGTTSGTSGHLDVLPDQGLVKLSQDFGEDAARTITSMRAEAIDRMENWVNQFDISCDFRRVPAQFYTESAERADRLREEFEHAQRIGLDVEIKSAATLPFPTAAALEVRNQARFHSMNYLAGLSRAVHGDNATIFENTRAEPPDEENPGVIRANDHEVVAKDVILATHGAYLGVSQFDVREAAYQSYVVAVQVEDGVPDVLYWDDEQPYHYIRRASSDDPRLLIIGGADHKTGQAGEQAPYEQLMDYISRRFTVSGVDRRWSAEFFDTHDGVPFIGQVPLRDHLFIAIGYSGTGLTYGAAAGKILADLILERSTPQMDVFSPGRVKPLAAAKDFISENLNVAKRFVADRFSAEPVESLKTIEAGQGRLVKLDGETYAVFRDEHNHVHKLSPACTHMGCFVQFNDAEKTWDCPCHGGRFSATGERMYGPPATDLKPASE